MTYRAESKTQGPVAQSKVSLTTSLRRQFVDYQGKNTVIFCWKFVRILCIAEDSHIFPTKNSNVFAIFTFETLTTR